MNEQSHIGHPKRVSGVTSVFLARRRRTRNDDGMPLSAVKRILICDDHPICAHGIASLVQTRINPKIEIQSFTRTKELLAELQRKDATPPDFIFLDLKMPEQSGTDLLHEMRSHPLMSQIIVMTVCDQPAILRQVLNFPVKGLLSKNADAATIELAMHKHPSTFVDPNLQSVLDETSGTPLTPREFQVAEALAKGHTNREISELFGCSPETIKSHRASIMRKLGMDNRAELIAWFQKSSN